MEKRYIDLSEALDEICKQVKNGEMDIINISCDPNLQPRYVTDTPEETARKNKLEYYEYTITIRKHFKEGE